MTASDPSDEPLRLPPAPAELPRPAIPVLTTLVPVAGALALWAVTGSPYMLWFAALGPLLAVASLLDGGIRSRRRLRTARRAQRAALAGAEADLDGRLARERARLRQRHPDLPGFVRDPEEIWRSVPGRDAGLVVGAGSVPSSVQVVGADAGEQERALMRRAREVTDAPVVVSARSGIAVVGTAVVAAAMVRALVLQMCLIHAPTRLRVVGDVAEVAAGVPHAQSVAAAALHVGSGERPCPEEVEFAIVRVAPGEPIPPRCAVVMTATAPGRAKLDDGERVRDVTVDAVSVEQARAVAAAMASRWEALERRHERVPGLDELLHGAPEPGAGGLPAVWATGAGEPLAIDLVADGPHALVVGMTGSGKSELLTSWIVALCARHSPQQVSFLLVDFKGGRTFDRLAVLPHVSGIVSDLDEQEALRAVESLRAEIRRRERALAASAARDVVEGGLGRLVVVVDEYAALVAAHPAVQDLLADVAARGRALGMHVILATQRADGVFRPALSANAPLRIALRVTGAAEASAVLGHAPAGATGDGVGLAWVRRAGDVSAVRLRVAQCPDDAIPQIAARWPGARAAAPWLPALAQRIALAEVAEPGRIALGRSDEPSLQAQPTVFLAPDDPGLIVVGQAGSGRTGILAVIAAQAARPHWIPSDPEVAWDALAGLDDLPRGTVVLVDDADLLLERLGGDHAVAAAERLALCARGARAGGIRLVVSSQRLTAPLQRVADAIPRRAILALASRADHAAAGGEAADHRPDLPPGRGRLGRTLVQFAACDASPAAAEPAPAAPWVPGRRAVGVVTGSGRAMRVALAAWRRVGVPTRSLDDIVRAGDGIGALRGAVVHGTAESWLAHWQLLAAVRADGDLVVDAACAAEYRTLTGRRDLPPFALAGRAWLLRADRDGVRRIALPAE